MAKRGRIQVASRTSAIGISSRSRRAGRARPVPATARHALETASHEKQRSTSPGACHVRPQRRHRVGMVASGAGGHGDGDVEGEHLRSSPAATLPSNGAGCHLSLRSARIVRSSPAPARGPRRPAGCHRLHESRRPADVAAGSNSAGQPASPSRAADNRPGGCGQPSEHSGCRHTSRPGRRRPVPAVAAHPRRSRRPGDAPNTPNGTAPGCRRRAGADHRHQRHNARTTRRPATPAPSAKGAT